MPKTSSSKKEARKPFTGWHMTAIMAAFFGIIMAVNFTMAGLATSGFSGTVVDNSYVASQKFNGWLAAAKAQEKLGWKMQMVRGKDRHISISVFENGSVLDGFSASARAEHPLGVKQAIALDFKASAPGTLRSIQSLPEGRWHLYVTVSSQGRTAYLERNLP